MTDALSITRFWRAWTLALALALPVLGQIAQDHPELCGKPNAYVPLPSNVSAVSSGDLESILTIRLGGSAVNIRMGAVEHVLEVCPIGGNKLLVFGLAHDPSGYDIYLIDATTGAKLDSFTVSDPAVSPNQHWLATREWEPGYVDPPSSVQYYLYDLTKDAAGNKLPGVDYRYVPHLGRTMYPATPKHLPFENDQPPERKHIFEGGSFQWAQDGQSVLFLDRTLAAGLVVVLVRIGADDLTTYIHPLGPDACASTLSRVDFGAAEGSAAPNVRMQFESSCPPLNLSGRDFKLAEIEVHKPIERKIPTILDKQ
jgi:hypothetical protein